MMYILVNYLYLRAVVKAKITFKDASIFFMTAILFNGAERFDIRLSIQ